VDLKQKFGQEQIQKALVPLTMAISKLSDDDANYVLFGLLASVQRKIDGGGWGNVSVEKSLMYEDIDMGVMLQLAVASFKENLAGFIDALP